MAKKQLEPKNGGQRDYSSDAFYFIFPLSLFKNNSSSLNFSFFDSYLNRLRSYNSGSLGVTPVYLTNLLRRLLVDLLKILHNQKI